MQVGQPTGPDDPAGHANRLETDGGTGDVVQARDVHGGVHFHQPQELFAVTPASCLARRRASSTGTPSWLSSPALRSAR
jgi:hypothetical protein